MLTLFFYLDKIHLRLFIPHLLGKLWTGKGELTWWEPEIPIQSPHGDP